MIGSVEKDKRGSPNSEYVIDCVIALGYAAEKSMAEDEQGSLKYYKDQDGVMHVPKRRLKDIMHVNKIR